MKKKAEKEILNTKHEIRNKSQKQSRNDQNDKNRDCFEHLNFEFRYCSGFRYSNLGFASFASYRFEAELR